MWLVHAQLDVIDRIVFVSKKLESDPRSEVGSDPKSPDNEASDFETNRPLVLME